MLTLVDACREVWDDPQTWERHPAGINGEEVFEEIRQKHPGAFPACNVIDVIIGMRLLFGPGEVR